MACCVNLAHKSQHNAAIRVLVPYSNKTFEQQKASFLFQLASTYCLHSFRRPQKHTQTHRDSLKVVHHLSDSIIDSISFPSSSFKLYDVDTGQNNSKGFLNGNCTILATLKYFPPKIHLDILDISLKHYEHNVFMSV